MYVYTRSKAMWAAVPAAYTTATCQLKLAREDVIVGVKTVKAVFVNMVFPILLK